MPDLLPSIRASIVAAASVTSELPAYAGSFPVFTRRPVPDAAPTLVVVVNPQVQAGANDGINDLRPIVVHDVVVYGQNGAAAGGVDEYRKVERIGQALQQLFHSHPELVSAAGWSTIDVTASGPSPAPTDDEQTVGRLVSVTTRLAKLLP